MRFFLGTVMVVVGVSALAVTMPSLASAQILTVPISGPVDPRVRTVTFKEDAVVSLRGHYGYQMSLEFGADERIENVSIGDSLAWQVTPNRRADTLFLKPIEFDASTNMSVITTKRRYTFQLSAEAPSGPGDPNIIYRVKFSYPTEIVVPPTPEPSVQPALPVNRSYGVAGSLKNVPSQVYDDGSKTYFEWPNGTPTPAVFAVGSDGQEAVVNFIMRGQTMVVERVGPAFILRNGTDETRITNTGWQEPPVGPLAPVVLGQSPSSGNGPKPSLMRRLFGNSRSGVSKP